MGKYRLWNRVKLLAMVVAIAGISDAHIALAESSNSDNYEASEMQFGSGGTLESCSDGYCANATIGDMTDGAESASKSAAAFGTEASTEPLLEVIVDPGESNLGVLSTEDTATKTMVVRVKTHLSDGYTLQIVGDPPRYQDHQLRTARTPTESTSGREQFGINLVANTSPRLGADPEWVPAEADGYDVVRDDYATPNMFMYRSGDVVAQSAKSSGRIDYTISMIVNVSNQTPAGHFMGDYAAIVTPTF